MFRRSNPRSEAIIERFSGQYVERDGVIIFDPRTALCVLAAADQEKCVVLGLDAFRITETTTQPLTSDSVDYSRGRRLPTNTIDLARIFIEARLEAGFLFEVVLADA